MKSILIPLIAGIAIATSLASCGMAQKDVKNTQPPVTVTAGGEVDPAQAPARQATESSTVDITETPAQ